MNKIIPLDVLSSIKGAEPSKSINKLFDAIENAKLSESSIVDRRDQVYLVEELREDVIIESSETSKQIIRDNFPKKKNGYLIVPKIIEI